MQVTVDNLQFQELDGPLSPTPNPDLPFGALIGGDITIAFGDRRFFYPDVSAIDCAGHFAMALAGYLVSPGKVFCFFGPDYSDHYVMKWTDEQAGLLAFIEMRSSFARESRWSWFSMPCGISTPESGLFSMRDTAPSTPSNTYSTSAFSDRRDGCSHGQARLAGVSAPSGQVRSLRHL